MYMCVKKDKTVNLQKESIKIINGLKYNRIRND